MKRVVVGRGKEDWKESIQYQHGQLQRSNTVKRLPVVFSR